ncbi:MAG TPA: PadR family transcriptional regulator [Anaerolineales bacterium]|nr:PadR family transcriptional regulator [Anaerolineales bacterium]
MTNAELAILSLVVEKPRHGYEIEQVIESRGMRDWTEIGFSSIYYLLKKLESKGYIQSELQQPEGRGPARKVYTATDAGRQAWHQGCLDAMRQPEPHNPSFLLGLSVLPGLEPEAARAALQAYLDELKIQMANAAEQRQAQQPLPPHVDAMFDYSLTLLQAEIGWLEEFIQHVQGQQV